MSTNPPIYSASMDDVYVYDYGCTVEVVNWATHGRKMFYQKQGRDNPWYIVRINKNEIDRELSKTGPPWKFPMCPTLSYRQ